MYTCIHTNAFIYIKSLVHLQATFLLTMSPPYTLVYLQNVHRRYFRFHTINRLATCFTKQEPVSLLTLFRSDLTVRSGITHHYNRSLQRFLGRTKQFLTNRLCLNTCLEIRSAQPNYYPHNYRVLPTTITLATCHLASHTSNSSSFQELVSSSLSQLGPYLPHSKKIQTISTHQSFNLFALFLSLTDSELFIFMYEPI